jgi:hypothetical protein
MSVISATPPISRTSTVKTTRERSLLAGVAISSFAALLLELALTRLFSVVLFYHFAFLAISIALLGLGSGGVFAYLGKSWLGRFPTRILLSWLCVANAVAVPLVLEIVLHVPVSLTLSRATLSRASSSRSSLPANHETFRGSTERISWAARWLVWELFLCSTGSAAQIPSCSLP